MNRISLFTRYKNEIKKIWPRVKWLAGYGKLHLKEMVIFTLLGLSGTLVSFLGGFASKDLVDIITGHQTGEVIKTFSYMLVITLSGLFISQLSTLFSNRIVLKVETEIKADVFTKILNTDWESLDKFHTGELMTRWGADSSSIASGILNFLPNFVINLFKFGGAFYIIARFDLSFALIALFGMPISFFFSRSLTRKMMKTNMQASSMNAKMSGFNQEAFSNVQTIKAFDMIHVYTDRLHQLQRELINMRMTYQKVSILVNIMITLVGLLISYASYGWGIYRVWSGAISYGTMTMFLSLSSQLSGTLNGLFNMIPTFISLTNAAKRVMDIVELPSDDYSHSEEVKEFIKEHGRDGIRIDIDQIRYSYRNGNEVFNGASFTASPHEIVALIGPSGEGKTTMFRVLLSLVRTFDGKKVLTASDGSSIELSASTRQLISYVPQGNTMFSGTIAENMRYVKEDATDEEIIEVLKTACAWEFIEKLPKGIYSEIKERGGGFSEGQAQRLSIARALLRKSPILLLDEATSALDPGTARLLLKNISRDEYPRTCVLTTHRPNMLKGCTRVYRISDKHCKELTHEEVQEIINS